jgi:hypothetical protein
LEFAILFFVLFVLKSSWIMKGRTRNWTARIDLPVNGGSFILDAAGCNYGLACARSKRVLAGLVKNYGCVWNWCEMDFRH